MKDEIYEELMKRAAIKCIEDGEYYDVDDNDKPGFRFSAGALKYMDDVGAVANKLCGMLSKEYIIDDGD